MRSIIVTIVIIVLIIAISIFSSYTLNNITDKMIQKNQQIELALKSHDSDEAIRLSQELSEYAAQKRSLLSTTIEHNSISNIDVYISEMRQYILSGCEYDALAKSAAVDKLLQELPRNYKLKAENIL